MNNTRLEQLPKVELHLHLDCSLSFSAAQSLIPGITHEQFKKDFVGPEKSPDLAGFLSCAQHAIDLIQTEQALRATVDGLFELLEADNVIYAEIRFAPLLHVNSGLTPEQVIEIVIDATSANTVDSGIQTSLILCTLRHYSEAQSMQTAKLAARYADKTPVAGIDIASDEAGHAIDAHIEAFKYAARKNIYRTAHAGEAKGPKSVWDSLRHFDAQRIGHGVRSIEDPALIEYLINNDIHLEVCPTSNIQTNVYDTISDHPINRLFDAGVSVGINTDSRTLVNATLNSEYLKLQKEFGWTGKHFYQCTVNALEHAFISNTEKARLRERVDQGFNLPMTSTSVGDH